MLKEAIHCPKCEVPIPANCEHVFKVWWIPQIPGKSFEVIVDSMDKAKLLTDVLGKYDLFQFENKIKPDYSNMGGIMVWQDSEWTDYDEEDEEEDESL